jgi:hypothetical protein
MGDALGPFFGSCERWSIVENEESMKKCDGVLNTGQKVGIGVGATVGGIGLIVGGILADRACHKRRGHGESDLLASGVSS